MAGTSADVVLCQSKTDELVLDSAIADADSHDSTQTATYASVASTARSLAVNTVESALGLPGKATQTVTDITYAASAKTRAVVTDLAKSATATAQEIGTAAKAASADSTVQKSAIGGATVAGTAGAATGGVAGAAVGSLIGVAGALFTFGLSIPVCAAAGAAIGGGTGAGIGGTTGFVGGGVAGYAISRRRAKSTPIDELQVAITTSTETRTLSESSWSPEKDCSLKCEREQLDQASDIDDIGLHSTTSDASKSRGLSDSVSSCAQEYAERVDRGTPSEADPQSSTRGGVVESLDGSADARNEISGMADVSPRRKIRQRSRLAYMSDEEYKNAVAEWVRNLTGLPEDADFAKTLRSGEVLCKLVNVICPGTIEKVEVAGSPFRERENISKFLQACRKLGVKEYALFSTDDLYEQNNLTSVMNCINALSSAVHLTVPDFGGPYLGVADTSKWQDTRRYIPPASQTGGLSGAMERTKILAPRQIIY